VPQIDAGLQKYLQRWEQRQQIPEPERAAFDARLADLLEQEVIALCFKLRTFNAEQIEDSNRKNQQIIDQLQWGMVAVAVLAPLSGLLLGYAVARSVYRSIYQLSVRIRDAAGKLSREVGSVTLEEKGDLPDLHKQMQGVLHEIGRVVDELEQREREVLRAEHLAAVGQVAAGVAHELRNPLTSIKMLVQTGLEDGSPAGLPAEDLAVIESEIRRIERRLQTFLDFARPPRCERRQADLNEVVRRAITLMAGRARRQKVTLETELPPAGVWLEIDPEQVHQVLVNLLLNALDVLPQGGTVRVEVEPAASGHNGNGAGGAVEVRVRDNGPGILPQISARLFEPFVSSKESGLGLGLSICKRLVEAHGGTIRGETLRRGALFTFTLPREEAHAGAPGRG
jgi:signal transduction histidine kinase